MAAGRLIIHLRTATETDMAILLSGTRLITDMRSLMDMPLLFVYIQQQQVVQTQSQGQAANYWHYCRNPEGYYPYVKKCPEGWLQVAPEPAQ
jgi:hypothetical protein